MEDTGDIELHLDGTLTICRFRGKSSMTALLAMAKSAQEFALKNKSSRLLVDIRGSDGAMKVAPRYMLATQMALFWNRSIRLAAVCREDQVLPDRFFEVVANNRSIEAKVFVDDDPERDARAWLLSLPDIELK